MKSDLGFVFEKKTGEAAEIEDFQSVKRAEIERMHEGCGFRECERAAFGEDRADELGTEIAIGKIQGDAQMTEKETEDAVGIVFAALKHIIYECFCAGIDFFRHIQPKQSAGDIALSAVESAVEMFFHESGRKRYGGVFPGEAVKNGQFRLERKGDMGERFAREQSDEPGDNGGGTCQQNVDGLHGKYLCRNEFFLNFIIPSGEFYVNEGGIKESLRLD